RRHPGPTLVPYTTLFRSSADSLCTTSRKNPSSPSCSRSSARRRRRAAWIGNGSGNGRRVSAVDKWLSHPTVMKVMALALGILLRSEEHTSELQSRENLVC